MRDTADLFNGYKLIQEKDGFRFSIDAVILSDFVGNLLGKKVLEVGTGTGVISILLSIKNKVDNILALEIQESVYDLALENVNLNNLNDKIEVMNIDFLQFLEKNSFDAIISNPPYMLVDGKTVNKEEKKAISRHEIKLTLEDFILHSYKVLKPRGELYFVHQSSRVQEIITLLSKYNFSIENLQFAHKNESSTSSIILIKAQKGRKSITKVMNPIFLNNQN